MAGGFWTELTAKRKAGWDELRNLGPVVALPPGIDTPRLLRPSADGRVYHLTRRRDVIAALHDTETFSSARRVEYERFPGLDVVDLPPIPTGLDPPEHTRYHKILQPLFGRDAVAELVPTLTRQATALIDAVAADGQCDAVSAVAIPHAAAGFQAFYGLPPQDVEELSWWKHTVLTAQPGFAYFGAVSDLFGLCVILRP